MTLCWRRLRWGHVGEILENGGMHADMRACWHHARQPGLRRGVRRGGSDRGVVDVDALGVEFVEGQRHGGVQL